VEVEAEDGGGEGRRSKSVGRYFLASMRRSYSLQEGR
jgi:hypothetical protein